MMATLVLRVYDGPAEVKAYSIDTEVLTVGVCEDAFRIVDIDALLAGDRDGSGDVARKVIGAIRHCYPVAKRLFPDLTEEEFDNCRPADVSAFLIGIVTYGLEQLAGGSSGKKGQ